MPAFQTFHEGDLKPGMVLGNLPLNRTLNADNLVINPGLTPWVRLTSDNATATNRTFTLTNGSLDGQVIFISLVGSASNAAELLSTGNVLMLGGTWTAAVGSVIQLIWDKTSGLWREVARAHV